MRPIIFKETNSRCQVDLIDMQNEPDSDYKFILLYQDHVTKFIQLRPLVNKRAEEFTHNLLDIFTILGALSILQSGNGYEFCQSQRSVERADQDVENMLMIWIDTNQTLHWSEDLRFVQFVKNRAHHEDINCSPSLGFQKKLAFGNL